MSTDPNDIPNADSSTIDETVTATVTRTVTTAGANGKETVVFSSTDVKSLKLSSDPVAHANEGGKHEPVEPEVPVLVTHVQHSEQVSSKAGDGLNDSLLNTLDSADDGEASGDLVVQQLLADMLRAGLKPKGPNKVPLHSSKQPRRVNTVTPAGNTATGRPINTQPAPTTGQRMLGSTQAQANGASAGSNPARDSTKPQAS